MVLLQRHPKGVSLTEAGRQFQLEAQRLMDGVAAMTQRMARVARGELGQLNIGFTSSAAAHAFTPEALRECRRSQPGVTLSLSEDNAAGITESVAAGRLHCGLIRVPVARPPGLEFEALLRSFTLPVVIDHMGRVPVADGPDQVPFRILLDLMKRPNYWVKVSGAERISAEGPPFRDAIPFARRLIEAAPDRTLWGTDWPHPNVRWDPDEADLVDLLPAFGDAAALQRVLVDNPARLYGFP